MMGIKGKPTSKDGKIMEPMANHGIKVMSMGFLIEEETPMIWRGPMVMSAITQLLRDVNWGELDVLVCDLPPGTGDTQLTMSQNVPLAGAVIVSTPQDIALLDAKKGLNMFRKVDVPVLGIIENMSYFSCPNCGHRSEIFAHGGARREAERFGVDFLGEIPLDIAIRETSDGGNPIVVSDPKSPHAAAYRDIAQKVWAKLAGARSARGRASSSSRSAAPSRHTNILERADFARGEPAEQAVAGHAAERTAPSSTASRVCSSSSAKRAAQKIGPGRCFGARQASMSSASGMAGRPIAM